MSPHERLAEARRCVAFWAEQVRDAKVDVAQAAHEQTLARLATVKQLRDQAVVRLFEIETELPLHVVMAGMR